MPFKPQILLVFAIGILSLASCRFGPMPENPNLGLTSLDNRADIHGVSTENLRQIISSFTRAEEALKRQDVETLMTIYSSQYAYHGLNKDHLGRMWRDLFYQYRDFSATHMFMRVIADTTHTPWTAEVTCTGSIWAVSRVTGAPVNIDSWIGEVHHLVHEDGAWRIRGQVGEPSKGPGYVLTPHPYF